MVGLRENFLTLETLKTPYTGFKSVIFILLKTTLCVIKTKLLVQQYNDKKKIQNLYFSKNLTQVIFECQQGSTGLIKKCKL